MACSNHPEPLTLDALRDAAHLQLLAGDLTLVRQVLDDLGALGHAKLGDLGERLATEFLQNTGWRDPGFTPGHQGFDRVFIHESGRVAIVESKATINGRISLGETKDGKQLCDRWIEHRLERMSDPKGAQGKGINPELAEALRAHGLENIDRILFVTRISGAEPDLDLQRVDAEGNVVGDFNPWSASREAHRAVEGGGQP